MDGIAMVMFTPESQDASPSPSEEILDTIAAQVQAIDGLVARARHSVRVFDADMSQMGWNTARRCDMLVQLLRRSRDARVQIIVHDTRYLESACPRLVALLRHWGSAVTIYRTGPQARGAADPLVIVDERHFLHRFHVEQPRASLVCDDPARTSPLTRRFEEIWATGEPGVGATVLGL